MHRFYCYTVGRTEPFEGITLDREEVEGVQLETISLTYNETIACIDGKLRNKIAKYFKKRPDELEDEDVAEYLVDVMHIDEKVKGYHHYFTKDW